LVAAAAGVDAAVVAAGLVAAAAVVAAAVAAAVVAAGFVVAAGVGVAVVWQAPTKDATRSSVITMEKRFGNFFIRSSLIPFLDK
jgi:hypothetical protein